MDWPHPAFVFIGDNQYEYFVKVESGLDARQKQGWITE
jgi:hypothetical protein